MIYLLVVGGGSIITLHQPVSAVRLRGYLIFGRAYILLSSG